MSQSDKIANSPVAASGCKNDFVGPRGSPCGGRLPSLDL